MHKFQNTGDSACISYPACNPGYSHVFSERNRKLLAGTNPSPLGLELDYSRLLLLSHYLILLLWENFNDCLFALELETPLLPLLSASFLIAERFGCLCVD